MAFKMLWSKARVYVIALAGIVLSVIAVIVRRTMRENSRLRVHVSTAEAKVNRARVVAQGDINAIQDEQVREAEIARDLQDQRDSYDPNDLFRVRDKDDS